MQLKISVQQLFIDFTLRTVSTMPSVSNSVFSSIKTRVTLRGMEHSRLWRFISAGFATSVLNCVFLAVLQKLSPGQSSAKQPDDTPESLSCLVCETSLLQNFFGAYVSGVGRVFVGSRAACIQSSDCTDKPSILSPASGNRHIPGFAFRVHMQDSAMRRAVFNLQYSSL